MNKEKQNPSQPLPTKKRIIDMMLGRNPEKVLDSASIMKETKERVSNSLKHGFDYDNSIWVKEASDVLRKYVDSKISLFIIFVDIVGYTQLSLNFPSKVADIVSSFSQEMGFVIKHHGGHLLKYVGDSVIGFFIGEEAPAHVADDVLNCAKSMISVVETRINPILESDNHPGLSVKVGIDFGENNVVRYGPDKRKSPIDIIGIPINIAAKIVAQAKPNEILIGKEPFEKLHPSLKMQFREIKWAQNQWNYFDKEKKELYKVYTNSL